MGTYTKFKIQGQPNKGQGSRKQTLWQLLEVFTLYSRIMVKYIFKWEGKRTRYVNIAYGAPCMSKKNTKKILPTFHYISYTYLHDTRN